MLRRASQTRNPPVNPDESGDKAKPKKRRKRKADSQTTDTRRLLELQSTPVATPNASTGWPRRPFLPHGGWSCIQLMGTSQAVSRGWKRARGCGGGSGAQNRRLRCCSQAEEASAKKLRPAAPQPAKAAGLLTQGPRLDVDGGSSSGHQHPAAPRSAHPSFTFRDRRCARDSLTARRVRAAAPLVLEQEAPAPTLASSSDVGRDGREAALTLERGLLAHERVYALAKACSHAAAGAGGGVLISPWTSVWAHKVRHAHCRVALTYHIGIALKIILTGGKCIGPDS